MEKDEAARRMRLLAVKMGIDPDRPPPTGRKALTKEEMQRRLQVLENQFRSKKWSG